MPADGLHLLLALLVPVAFLLGSIPTGVLIARRRGVDLRSVGSGNVGATNAGRALGRRFFHVVLALDALKAFAPTAAASGLVHALSTPDMRAPLTFGLWLTVGAAAVLGHVFSPFLGFRGGKGVACGLGFVLGVFPFLTLPGLVGAAVFVGAFRATRYVSVGSILAALTLPAAYGVFAWRLGWPIATQWPVPTLLSAVATLLIWRHRENVRRLIDGSEAKT